jgi:CRISPR-associated protein Csn2
MKIVHSEIDTQFVFNGKINVLVVEDGRLFRKYCEEIFTQTQGGEGLFVLSEDDKILPISKYAFCIYDYFFLCLDDKKYINKLYADLCATADEKFTQETAELMSGFDNFFEKLNAESDIPLEYTEEAPVAALLKCFGIKPLSVFPTFLEKLIAYIDGIRAFTATKLFCFINLKSFLSKEELALFYDYAKKNELSVILFESKCAEKNESEFTVVIDKDLCEIIV